MNERIKELVKQATTIEVISGRGFDTTQYIDRFDKEKFAELIVRECIGRIQLHQQMDETTADWVYNSLKSDLEDHFGVEE